MPPSPKKSKTQLPTPSSTTTPLPTKITASRQREKVTQDPTPAEDFRSSSARPNRREEVTQDPTPAEGFRSSSTRPDRREKVTQDPTPVAQRTTISGNAGHNANHPITIDLALLIVIQ